MKENQASFFSLAGQVAVVTGGATGIGAAIVQRLAQAGATVYIADVDAGHASETAASLNVLSVAMDVTQRQSVQAAIASVLDQSGHLDILVNNAGIAGKAAPIWEQTDDDWAKISRST